MTRQLRPGATTTVPLRAPRAGGGGSQAGTADHLATAWARRGASPREGQAPPLLANVRWSIVFIAFLAYIFAITTYRLPIGNLAMIAGLAGLAILHERVRTPRLLLWFAAFILWCAIGYVQTPYPREAWDGLVDLVKLLAVTMVAVNALRTRAHIRLFTVFFLGCFALFPLRGALFNYFIYHSTVFGRAIWNYVYSNPNDLAALALLQLSMVAALLSVERNGWVKRAGQVGIVLLPLLVLMTQSRGGFLALFVFAVAAMIGCWQQFRSLLTAKHRLRLVLAGIGAMTMVALFAPDGVWDRVSGLKHLTTTDQLDQVDEEGSARQRYEIWKVAMKIVGDHPLAGIGIAAYPQAHESYARGEEFNPTARGRRDTHSTILNLLAETGVPGTAAFLGLVLTTVIGAERVRRRCTRHAPAQVMPLYLLEIGLLAFFTAGLFGSFAHLSFLYVHLALLFAMTELAREELGSRLAHVPHPNRFSQ